MKAIHFLSGLPRSGSTLLASLLNQNPAFTASIATPLGQIYQATHGAMGTANESVDMMNPGHRFNILRGLFESYYYFDATAVTAFDNNRAWSARCHELFELFTDAKMVCMVRPVNAILNSFERIYRNDPLLASTLFGSGSNTTTRTNTMMAPGGVVQASYSNTKDAFYSGYTDRILFVRYQSLCTEPKKVVGDIVEFCTGERWDGIDPKNVKNIEGVEKFDERLGLEGLHELYESVALYDQKQLLPPDIWMQHQHSEFWNDPDLKSGIRVI